jgi:hypothetical protein
MKRMTMLLTAAALSALALAALPAMAMAEEETPVFNTTPVLSFAEYPAKFTGTSKVSTLYREGKSAKVICKTDAASGSFENGHTGSVKIIFEECEETVLHSKCQSGATKGTIETETLPFHLVYIEPTNAENLHETPGILITPNHETGYFAKFNCASNLVKINVKGNGVVGTVTEPAINGSGTMGTIDITATSTAQEHTTVVASGKGEEPKYEKFQLEANENGGAYIPAFQDSKEDTLTFAKEGTTTTETP